jgi:hypothetical protein
MRTRIGHSRDTCACVSAARLWRPGSAGRANKRAAASPTPLPRRPRMTEQAATSALPGGPILAILTAPEGEHSRFSYRKLSICRHRSCQSTPDFQA